MEKMICRCNDCDYVGEDFTQECLPCGDSGEFWNYEMCPECFSCDGYILEIFIQ